MSHRIMLDIETLGREPGCAIISLGAVGFDDDDGELFASVSVESCQRHGLDIDAETLEWWLTQDDEAKQQLVGGDDLYHALYELAEFIPDDVDEVWANSPAFDCRILEAAFEAVEIDVPWSFYHTRDVRTIKNLDCAVDIEQDGVGHDALDDARFQVRQVVGTLERIDEGVER